MKTINNIDLWSEYKKEQIIDGFVYGYKDGSFDFDEIVICPNLVGYMKVDGVTSAACPHFKGGLVFLKSVKNRKKGTPVRVMLFFQNKTSNLEVEKYTGGKRKFFGCQDAIDVMCSKEPLEEHGISESLFELLEKNNITITTDKTAKAHFWDFEKTEKDDVNIYSADNLELLKEFLGSPEDWANLNAYNNVNMLLSFTAAGRDFEIMHKGAILGGIKKETEKNKAEAAAILLQDGDKNYYEMYQYAIRFSGLVFPEKDRSYKSIHLGRNLK